MTAPPPRLTFPVLASWRRRILQWALAGLVVTGVLSLLTNQLFLGYRASGKSLEWMQAAAWAIPTLLAWCACLPLVVGLAARRPIAPPLRASNLAFHLMAGLATCGVLLGLHLAISWVLGWIPRDVGILRFEFVMTGRAYGGFNLFAYWGIVAWVSAKPGSIRPRRTPATEPVAPDRFVVQTGSRKLLVPVGTCVGLRRPATTYGFIHPTERISCARRSKP